LLANSKSLSGQYMKICDNLRVGVVVKFEGAPKTGKYVLTEMGKKMMMEELGYGV
jgi:hypothetical protein